MAIMRTIRFSACKIARLSHRLVYASLLCLSGYPAWSDGLGLNQIKNFRTYGFFSPSVVHYDDGRQSDTYLADNSAAPGRFGIWFDIPAQRGEYRFNFETSLGLRLSSSVSQSQKSPLLDLNAATLRKFELIFRSDRAGSLSFGQGSMGSDSTAESDLSGTTMAGYVGIADTVGGFFFRDTSGMLTTVDIASAYPTFDGGRAPRIRWDSPDLSLDALGTFTFAVSAGIEVSSGGIIINDALADTGVFYRNKIGETDIKASAGFSLANVNDDLKPQTVGSISLLHNPTKLNITFAAGVRESGGQYGYSKIGWTDRFLKWGETAISFDYYNGKGTVTGGSQAEAYGIGLVQNFESADLSFYLGWRSYKYQQPGGVRFEPSNSLVFGTRWDFRELRGLQRRTDWRDQE